MEKDDSFIDYVTVHSSETDMTCVPLQGATDASACGYVISLQGPLC